MVNIWTIEVEQGPLVLLLPVIGMSFFSILFIEAYKFLVCTRFKVNRNFWKNLKHNSMIQLNFVNALIYFSVSIPFQLFNVVINTIKYLYTDQ